MIKYLEMSKVKIILLIRMQCAVISNLQLHLFVFWQWFDQVVETVLMNSGNDTSCTDAVSVNVFVYKFLWKVLLVIWSSKMENKVFVCQSDKDVEAYAQKNKRTFV